MEPVRTALADEQRALSDLLGTLDGDGWRAPSRCEGWTVADVVLHLAQTNEMAVASLAGTFDEFIERMTGGAGPMASVDDGAALMVERERGASPDLLNARWEASAAELRAGFEAVDLHARVSWVAGELSAQTLATTRLAETWIHAGDVAAAFGPLPEPTDRLWHIARLAWRTLPYAFARAGRTLSGPVAFVLSAPNGDEWTFAPDDGEPRTTVTGDAVDLCLVAGQRAGAADTGLQAEGPDGEAVLALVRTFA
ncbi:MAG TPA: maleylpyruvate isomerase family mycothiol-dependent enzyme [Acidimicrobiales bacterium]|nr:maleylpyruvate isomerase family mycothiol-dependent enzyme [Acidimicrobiales bacterium]